jgi:hypothetical protein
MNHIILLTPKDQIEQTRLFLDKIIGYYRQDDNAGSQVVTINGDHLAFIETPDQIDEIVKTLFIKIEGIQ